jgi:hypothetical protein
MSMQRLPLRQSQRDGHAFALVLVNCMTIKALRTAFSGISRRLQYLGNEDAQRDSRAALTPVACVRRKLSMGRAFAVGGGIPESAPWSHILFKAYPSCFSLSSFHRSCSQFRRASSRRASRKTCILREMLFEKPNAH